jgi:hypothetical protein
MNPLVGATSGAVGACVALSATYPLVIAKVRLQAQRRKKLSTAVVDAFSKQTAAARAAKKLHLQRSGVPNAKQQQPSGALQIIMHIVGEEGPLGLYTGLGAALFKAAATNFIFYFFFSLLGAKVFNVKAAAAAAVVKKKQRKSMAMSMLHGICAGICVQFCVLPIDMIVNRLQTAKAGGATGLRALMNVCSDIVAEGGIFNFWAALVPGLALTVNPGITTVMRDALSGGKTMTRAGNFWTGVLSKATAATLTYPYSMAKVQMQTAKKTVVGGGGQRSGSNKDGGAGVRTRSAGGAPASAPSSKVDTSSTRGLGPTPPRPSLPRVPSTNSILAQSSSVPKAPQPVLPLSKQARKDRGDELAKVETLMDVFSRVFKSDGVGGLYKGLLPQLSAAVLKEGILNLVRLEIAVTVRKVFVKLGLLGST